MVLDNSNKLSSEDFKLLTDLADSTFQNTQKQNILIPYNSVDQTPDASKTGSKINPSYTSSSNKPFYKEAWKFDCLNFEDSFEHFEKMFEIMLPVCMNVGVQTDPDNDVISILSA
ncbi:hypothetical protein Ciccas_010282 [Cichlidogyrus casuarinus]|uniref:Uncharacterized protein n=1 Tax=Cichlidogyrus casuarinus TaxID=1844966 RepID=A0ABD2PVN6_9PLAT